MPARQILDFDEKALNWSPSLINSNKEQVESIIHTLDNKDELISWVDNNFTTKEEFRNLLIKNNIIYEKGCIN